MTKYRLEKYFLQPIPELSPEQVIKIQLNNLQRNDENDNGIQGAFVFASPANKASTGPVQRFIRMVKNPLYKPMLNFRRAQLQPIHIAGDIAQQLVTLVDAQGQSASYLFTLSRQPLGPYMGCWMTDSVQRVEILV